MEACTSAGAGGLPHEVSISNEVSISHEISISRGLYLGTARSSTGLSPHQAPPRLYPLRHGGTYRGDAYYGLPTIVDPRWHAISPLVRQRLKHTRAALQRSELGLCPRPLAAPPIAQNGVGRLCRLTVVIGQLSTGQGQLHLKEHILRHENRRMLCAEGYP